MNILIFWLISGAIAYLLFAIKSIKIDNMDIKELFYPRLINVMVWVLFLLCGFISLIYIILVYISRYIEGR